MGICPKCAMDSHKEHTGQYPVKIGGKGLGAKTRVATCECSVCVKRAVVVAPPTNVVEVGLIVRTGKWTDSICPDCGDPGHWLYVPVGVSPTEAKTSVMVTTPFKKPRVSCFGCPRCVERAKNVVEVVE